MLSGTYLVTLKLRKRCKEAAPSGEAGQPPSHAQSRQLEVREEKDAKLPHISIEIKPTHQNYIHTQNLDLEEMKKVDAKIANIAESKICCDLSNSSTAKQICSACCCELIYTALWAENIYKQFWLSFDPTCCNICILFIVNSLFLTFCALDCGTLLSLCKRKIEVWGPDSENDRQTLRQLHDIAFEAGLVTPNLADDQKNDSLYDEIILIYNKLQYERVVSEQRPEREKKFFEALNMAFRGQDIQRNLQPIIQGYAEESKRVKFTDNLFYHIHSSLFSALKSKETVSLIHDYASELKSHENFREKKSLDVNTKMCRK